MLIKICGLRDNYADVVALKPDFAGLIFYQKSPRFVELSQAPVLKQKLHDVNKVGVFVNADKDYILDKVSEYNLDLVQLHGNESPDFCADIRKCLPVIKAFGIASESDLQSAEKYAQYVDYLLFDTKTKGYGGSGVKFDWHMLQNVNISQKFLLSGGISLDDLDDIKALKINNLVGVDLNSRFEDAPGLKNIEKLKQALNILRK
ncbi:MAG: phosphoribosylanthranilate isomerase [Bacteroidales bacterium]|nr:phosphoribosylanthranilate isomerase [Bacteroidales bacterium]